MSSPSHSPAPRTIRKGKVKHRLTRGWQRFEITTYDNARKSHVIKVQFATPETLILFTNALWCTLKPLHCTFGTLRILSLFCTNHRLDSIFSLFRFHYFDVILSVCVLFRLCFMEVMMHFFRLVDAYLAYLADCILCGKINLLQSLGGL